MRRWLNAEALAAEDGHGHGPSVHAHDVNRHDARIRAFCIRHEAPLPLSALDLFIALLANAHGPNLLRIKGIVALADDPARPVIIHGVQHVFHAPLRLAAWPDDDHTTRIVLILRDMDQAGGF